jgi:heavy metal sensor kinase
MLLQKRLTLLYTTLAGGVLMLFGSLVYGLVSVVLLNQVDASMTQSADQIIAQLRITSSNHLAPRTSTAVQLGEGILFQVWGNDRQLQFSRPPGQQQPLDESGMRSGRPIFNTVEAAKSRMRVLSVPLKTERGPAGILQVGENLELVDVALSALLSAQVALAILAMALTGLMAWIATGRALAPLATVTKVATQITKADDLSRRIPLAGETSGEVGQLILAFNDTLERLEQLFTTQRRFMADVSHELRTPLTVIKGNVGLMRRMGESDEESMASIEMEVDRLSRLVGDLLLLAQAESGRLPLDMAPVELDTILLEVFQQMRVLTGERLQLKLSEIDQIQLIGDRDRLKQVMLNLAGNAIQYTPAGGIVTLSLRKNGEQAQLIVSDSGPGIPAQDLPHIFERFYRGEKSRKRNPGTGFGLGLSIAYWIVRNHGGTIDVSSQEGKGTTFSVLLPIRKLEAALQTQPVNLQKGQK